MQLISTECHHSGLKILDLNRAGQSWSESRRFRLMEKRGEERSEQTGRRWGNKERLFAGLEFEMIDSRGEGGGNRELAVIPPPPEGKEAARCVLLDSVSFLLSVRITQTNTHSLAET